MKVAQIMTTEVHTISPDKTLKECMMELNKHHINGLVVVDATRAIGIITKADLFKALLPTYADIMEDECNIAHFDYIEERAQRFFDIKVRDFIGMPLMTIESSMPVVKAGSFMVLRRVKQVPVVDNGRLVGIITLTDILNAIGERLK